MLDTQAVLASYTQSGCGHGSVYLTKLNSAALPTLDVNEGALNEIFRIYKKLLPRMDGHLIENGSLVPRRLEMLLAELALLEEEVLQQRAE